MHKLFGTAPFCIRFVSSISGRGRVYQMGTNLDVKLRLSEINRKSAELSAVSSRLADMASQLNRLRKLNGRIGFLSGRNRPSSRRNDDSYTSRCELADSIIELVQPPSPVCYFSFMLPRQFSARRTHRFYCRLKSQHWKVRQETRPPRPSRSDFDAFNARSTASITCMTIVRSARRSLPSDRALKRTMFPNPCAKIPRSSDTRQSSTSHGNSSGVAPAASRDSFAIRKGASFSTIFRRSS